MKSEIVRGLLALALAVCTMIAQSKPGARETETFRLTMPKINSAISAYRSLIETLASDAALAKRVAEAEEQLEDTNGRDSLSMVAERLEKQEPKLAAAYRSAGITPKEAGMTMETLMGVMLGASMMEASGANAKLPEGFVAENVDFYRQHKTEIQECLQQMSNLSEKAKAFAAKSDEEEQK